MTQTSLGESREAFMARIRRSLGHPTTQVPAEPAPEPDQDITRLARETDDLPAMFTERAQVVGMKVHPVTGDSLLRALYELLEKLEAKNLVVGVGSLPQAVGLKESLRRKGYEIIDWSADPGMDAQFIADVGITDVHGALAESGTLICCSDAGHSRGLSLIPAIHVAIVRHSDILPDQFDYWNRMKGIPGEQLPSSIAFITGPSKTADIEGELVKGVHGPKEVHIFLVGPSTAE